jgi:hypothetical protein
MLAMLLAGSAQAATLSLQGGDVYPLPDRDPLRALSAFDDVGLPELVPGILVSRNSGLWASGPAMVTLRCAGSEASYTNTLSFGGERVCDNREPGTTATFRTDGGLLPMEWTSSGGAGAVNGATAGFYSSLAWLLTGNGHGAVWGFNDGALVDRDYDDHTGVLTVAPVPLPAAGLMLMGALGLLAAARRRARA